MWHNCRLMSSSLDVKNKRAIPTITSLRKREVNSKSNNNRNCRSQFRDKNIKIVMKGIQ